MTDGEDTPEASFSGEDVVTIERLVRVRWLLSHPLRVRITAALLLYEDIEESPSPAELSLYLHAPKHAVAEQLGLMRHQGAVEGDFWLRDAAGGSVKLVSAISSALTHIAEALGPPPANIPAAPRDELPKQEDSHLRAPTADDLLAHSYVLLRRQGGGLRRHKQALLAFAEMLADPMRIDILLELLLMQQATTTEIVEALEQHRTAPENQPRGADPHRDSEPPVDAASVGDQVRVLADGYAILPVPRRRERWTVSGPMRSALGGTLNYLQAVRDLDDASTPRDPRPAGPIDPEFN